MYTWLSNNRTGNPWLQYAADYITSDPIKRRGLHDLSWKSLPVGYLFKIRKINDRLHFLNKQRDESLQLNSDFENLEIILWSFHNISAYVLFSRKATRRRNLNTKQAKSHLLSYLHFWNERSEICNHKIAGVLFEGSAWGHIWANCQMHAPNGRINQDNTE